MTIDELRDLLGARIEAARADPVGNDFLVRGAELGSAELREITFEQGMAATVRSDVLEAATAVLSREWLPYDPSYSLSTGQAFADDLTQVPELARLHATVVSGRAPGDRGGDGEPILAMAHEVFSNPQDGIVAYRLKGPGIATKRPRGIRALLAIDGVFEEVKSEIVYYEGRFDAIVVGDSVLVTATTTLTRVLGSTDRIRALARSTFAKATRRLTIEGAERLADAVATDPAMASKMAQLARILDADPAYADLLTTENLVDFLERNPAVHIATAGEGQQRRLVFEPSPQTRYAIVKLMADDYLRSDLSKRSYEAGSKAPLEP
jgi:hypothetical protein